MTEGKKNLEAVGYLHHRAQSLIHMHRTASKNIRVERRVDGRVAGPAGDLALRADRSAVRRCWLASNVRQDYALEDRPRPKRPALLCLKHCYATSVGSQDLFNPISCGNGAVETCHVWFKPPQPSLIRLLQEMTGGFRIQQTSCQSVGLEHCFVVQLGAAAWRA